ncbi:T9SS type A sorting domain-containing protein [Rhodocytophaga aerolata]|uniref:T9SS type A sorting domain-containing protein n=1 Tax=Rhodocytophaga aerolata TaxID=455078 RepID=A0ABT8RGA6_9BACT|nr:T9SS type A sorting domain-containing protein [Rhodocytophaga aerolata]MDO1451125.1 T9SS type A sorting domain-containing protein [Rhodocytophaga aerolata]
MDQIIIQPDQKILLNGRADYINDIRTEGIVRINQDGSLDPSFHISNTIADYTWIALRPDGKILATNLYSNSEGKSQFYVHLLDSQGRIDSTYYTDIVCDYPSSKAFALQTDEKILLGANTYANSTYEGKVYRLHRNGRKDTTFHSEQVKATWISQILLQPNGKIILLGGFYLEAINRHTSILRLNSDGSIDPSFAYSPLSAVSSAIIQPDGQILVSRDASSASNGSTSIVRLNPDGSQDNTFQLPTTSPPMAIYSFALQPNGKILAGSWIRKASNDPSGYSRVIRFNSDGSFDESFDNGQDADHLITSLAIQQDGKLLIGGLFTTYNSQSQAGLIRLTTNGSIDTSFKIRLEYSGYIGVIARQQDERILVGGGFSSANGKTQNRLTRLTSSGRIDTTFSIGTGPKGIESSSYADIRDIKLQKDGKIVVGGKFTSFNDQATSSLVRLNGDGSIDQVFQLAWEADYSVEEIVIRPDGKILVGGAFPYNYNPQKTLLRLLPDGKEDPSFNIGSGFNGGITSLCLQEDGKILVSGSFTQYDGMDIGGIVRLLPDGSLDTSFTIGLVNNAIEQILLQADGKILLEGSYVSYQNYLASKLIRLHSDGTFDNTFNPTLGMNDYIEDMTIQPDGRILLAGSFHSPRRHFIQLNADGSATNAFFSFAPELTLVVNKLLIDSSTMLVATFSGLERLTQAAPQSIVFNAIEDKLTSDAPFSLSASASSGLPVTFTVVSGPASVSGNILTLSGIEGVVTIRASQKGNSVYLAATDVERAFRVNAVLGLEEIREEVKIYPNPTIEQFVFTLPFRWQVKEIRLVDMLGKPQKATILNTSTGYRVTVHQYTPGLYLLLVKTNEGEFIKKVILK